MKQFTTTQKLTISAIVIAMYIVLMFMTQSFAFGQFQVRIATALYALAAIFPFIIVPLGIANFLSNLLMGGLGPLDIVGGACVGMMATGLIVLAKRSGLGDWVVIPVTTLVPALVVPLWLSYLLHIPYWTLVPSIIVGQLVSGIVGFILVRALATVGVTKTVRSQGGN